MNRNRRLAIGWLALGIAAFTLAPWYALPDGVLHVGWLAHYLGRENAPAIVQAVHHGRAWLLPLALLLLGGAYFAAAAKSRTVRGHALIVVGALGFLYLLAQGFAIGARGFSYPSLAAAGQLEAELVDLDFFDIGNPADLARTREALEAS